MRPWCLLFCTTVKTKQNRKTINMLLTPIKKGKQLNRLMSFILLPLQISLHWLQRSGSALFAHTLAAAHKIPSPPPRVRFSSHYSSRFRGQLWEGMSREKWLVPPQKRRSPRISPPAIRWKFQRRWHERNRREQWGREREAEGWGIRERKGGEPAGLQVNR